MYDLTAQTHNDVSWYSNGVITLLPANEHVGRFMNFTRENWPSWCQNKSI